MTQTKKTIKNLLADFGLDEREAEIYLALLNDGPMLPQHLAQATGINRATLYTLFPELIKIGLIKEVKQGKRRLMSPVSPEELFNQYENRYKQLKASVGELATMYRMHGLKPKIEVFEGIEAIKKLYLSTLESKGELLVYNRISRYRKDFLEWMNKVYVPKRVNLGVKVRALVTADPAGETHMASGKEFARETRFVPAKFIFRNESMIFGDKIAFFTCEAQSPAVGIVVQSKTIVESQKNLFELAWIGANTIVKSSNLKIKN